jgi:formamidopyrimidine-DNA glycosylase
MPELPEAEVWRAALARALAGRRVAGFACSQPGFVRVPPRDVAGFAAAVVGRRVAGVERLGKRLLFRLDDGRAIDLGLGLWVRLELRHAPLEPLKGAQLEFSRGAVASSSEDDVVFLTVSEIALATIRVVPYRPAGPPPPFDALDERLDGAFLASLAPARGSVKAFLTDDRYILGIGNGYSDELLWRARVNPRRRCDALSPEEWAAVSTALHEVLTAAQNAGGEEGFVGPGGHVGAYHRPIHHHGGEPCPRCGSPLASVKNGRRETNFCPVCQPP